MNTVAQAGVEAQLAEMMSLLIELKCEIQNRPVGPAAGRTAYTVEEAASLLGKAPFTVRQWSPEGRIDATKRLERRGNAGVWSISADEVERYRNEGLLKRVPIRRAG